LLGRKPFLMHICVLCIMYYVLCIVYCVLCIVIFVWLWLQAHTHQVNKKAAGRKEKKKERKKEKRIQSRQISFVVIYNHIISWCWGGFRFIIIWNIVLPSLDSFIFSSFHLSLWVGFQPHGAGVGRGGGSVHVEMDPHGSMLVTGGVPCTMSCLTRTGMTWPVVRPHVRWFSTSRG